MNHWSIPNYNSTELLLRFPQITGAHTLCLWDAAGVYRTLASSLYRSFLQGPTLSGSCFSPWPWAAPSCRWIFLYSSLPSYLAFLFWLRPLPELSVDTGPSNGDHSLPQGQVPAAGKFPKPPTHSVPGSSPPVQSLWLWSKTTQEYDIISVILQVTFYHGDRQSRVTMY